MQRLRLSFSEDSDTEEQYRDSATGKDDSTNFHEADEEAGFNYQGGMDLSVSDFEQIIELSNTITTLPDAGVPTKDLLNNIETNLIRTALDQTDGNVSKASELLQMGRTSLIQKINKYELDKD